jgi:DNA-binding XRE family transcriptional regulator
MISDNFRKARMALKLSQTAFGEKIGVSIDVIKNIEYNRVKPSDLLIRHACDIHHIDKDWL